MFFLNGSSWRNLTNLIDFGSNRSSVSNFAELPGRVYFSRLSPLPRQTRAKALGIVLSSLS